jgi:predicted molibdopterin-dependent oxidoreductase YjgC
VLDRAALPALDGDFSADAVRNGWRVHLQAGVGSCRRLRAGRGSERSTSRFPLILTTGRILTQYNVGAQTRRTGNVVWHAEDLLEIHPHDAEVRGISDGDWVGLTSRAGEMALRAKVSEKIAPGVVYTTFHFPETNANVVTTENSDWATNCPEYKVTAVEVVLVSQKEAWQKRAEAERALPHPARRRRHDRAPA